MKLIEVDVFDRCRSCFVYGVDIEVMAPRPYPLKYAYVAYYLAVSYPTKVLLNYPFGYDWTLAPIPTIKKSTLKTH